MEDTEKWLAYVEELLYRKQVKKLHKINDLATRVFLAKEFLQHNIEAAEKKQEA